MLPKEVINLNMDRFAPIWSFNDFLDNTHLLAALLTGRILKMEKIFIPRWINNIIFWKMYGKNETTFCLAKKSQVKGGKQLLTRTLRTTTTTINLIMSNTCCAFSFLFFNAFKVCYYLHTGCIPFSYLIKKIMIFFYIFIHIFTAVWVNF